MDLFNEIITRTLEREEVHITFPGLCASTAEIVEAASYRALQKKKTIIEDDSLSDFECIEKIVCVFEDIGSGGGNRHDFG